MSQADFVKWLADGPGALSPERVSAALTWRDTHPVEARTLEARHREVRREAQDRESLRAVWMAKGGDELREPGELAALLTAILSRSPSEASQGVVPGCAKYSLSGGAPRL
jgi:hypothetical protein